MVAQNVLANLNRNLKQLTRMQDQLSSGKTVSRPSDDPVNVARIMRLQSMVREQEKYQSNMENAQGFLDNAEAALSTISDVLNRARELAIDGANGDMSASDRLILLSEAEELIGEALGVANTSFDGRYIFGGYQTEDPPFSLDAAGNVVYAGDNGEMKWEIAHGVTIPVNIPGQEVFLGAAGSVFGALVSLRVALEYNDPIELSGSVIGEIDSASNHISSQRAIYGARSNRLEIAIDRAFQSNINLTEVLSKLEDVDWAEASMHYATAKTVYDAALATGAQVIQPTLLDYLR